ncbi:MAG: hypothetical protein LBP52_02885 [Burkholderiaceae bacterium]|jgi:hypothetical protein|nr:hypothetical protein [Burkholderiaceae bacterium]
MTDSIISRLPKWRLEEAEKWIAGKFGLVQDNADIALEAQDGLDDIDERVLASEPDSDYSIRFCAGDLVADDLPITCACLIVAGNLRVKGLLQSDMMVEEGALIVLGDVEAGRYVSRGMHTVICGNLRAGHVATNSLNDLDFSVGGNVEAESFAEFGEYVEIHGNLKVDKLINDVNTIDVRGGRDAKRVIDRSTPEEQLATLLKKEVIKTSTFDGETYTYIDGDAYMDCLRQNTSPFL